MNLRVETTTQRVLAVIFERAVHLAAIVCLLLALPLFELFLAFAQSDLQLDSAVV